MTQVKLSHTVDIKEIQIVYRLFLVDCYLMYGKMPQVIYKPITALFTF